MVAKPEDVTASAKRMLRRGLTSFEANEAAERLTEKGARAFMMLVAVKMDQLVATGYEAQPVPDLGVPTRLQSGELKFLAPNLATRRRAEAALASGATERWEFSDGVEDQSVVGQVTSVQPVYQLAYFTIRPAEEWLKWAKGWMPDEQTPSPC